MAFRPPRQRAKYENVFVFKSGCYPSRERARYHTCGKARKLEEVPTDGGVCGDFVYLVESPKERRVLASSKAMSQWMAAQAGKASVKILRICH